MCAYVTGFGLLSRLALDIVCVPILLSTEVAAHFALSFPHSRVSASLIVEASSMLPSGRRPDDSRIRQKAPAKMTRRMRSPSVLNMCVRTERLS